MISFYWLNMKEKEQKKKCFQRNKSRGLCLVSKRNEYASFSFRIMSICSIRSAIYLLSLAEDFSRGGGRAKPLLALSSLLCCLEKKLLFECILTNTRRQLSFLFMLFQWFMLKQMVVKVYSCLTLIFAICHANCIYL